MIAFLAHWAFEMGGSACWAGCRGRCTCRRHRIAGDMTLTALLTLVLMHVVG